MKLRIEMLGVVREVEGELVRWNSPNGRSLVLRESLEGQGEESIWVLKYGSKEQVEEYQAHLVQNPGQVVRII